MSNEQPPRLEPVVSLVHNKSPDGTYFAQMTVSGFRTEAQAGAALDHMQRLFCGAEMEIGHEQ